MAIGLDDDAAHLAASVLAAHRVACDILRCEALDRVEHLGLLRPHCVGFEARRRFHGGERQQLEQVVRHHVTKRAGGVVKIPARSHACRLGNGDLDVVDVVAVPQRLEQAVGEPQHHQVLHRLLSEVVIDPVDLALVQRAEKLAIECPGREQVRPERLLHDDPPPAVITALARKPASAEISGNG